MYYIQNQDRYKRIAAMGAEDIVKAVVTNSRGDRKGLYETGFYGLGGFISAFIIHDLWRMFGLPGGNDNLVIQGFDTGIRNDQFYQMLLAAPLILGEIFLKLKGGGAGAGGYLTGIAYLNKSELGKYIGFG